jgi:hypothetical protein
MKKRIFQPVFDELLGEREVGIGRVGGRMDDLSVLG